MDDTRKSAMLIFRDEGVDWAQLAADGRSKALFQKLVDWAADLKRRGVYDGVEALDRGGKTVRRKGAGLVIDGPFAEGREAVLGYFVVRVNDIDEACALAGESPHVEVGGTTEVRMLGSFPKPVAKEQTLDEMKAFVRQHFEDFVNRKNAGVIHENMTADFVDHDGPGGKSTGVEGDEKMMLAMYGAMPDLHVEIEDMIAEGDKVMCRNTWRWTASTTGKAMAFSGFVLWRLADGKIAERWATVTPPKEV